MAAVTASYRAQGNGSEDPRNGLAIKVLLCKQVVMYVYTTTELRGTTTDLSPGTADINLILRRSHPT